MSAKRPRNAEKTREEILNTSASLFARRGYAATSMRDIAGAINIQAPTMYHYFESKEVLLKELFASLYDRLRHLYVKLSKELKGSRLEKGLSHFMRSHRRFVEEHRDLALLFFHEGLRPEGPAARELAQMATPSNKALTVISRAWPGEPGRKVMPLLLAIIGSNLFFVTAEEYLTNLPGTNARSEIQQAAIEEYFLRLQG